MTIAEKCRNLGLGIVYQLGKKHRLESKNPLLSPQDFAFVFFELFGDITLGTHKGLLTNPLGRHSIFMGITHLYVVAKDVIKAHL